MAKHGFTQPGQDSRGGGGLRVHRDRIGQGGEVLLRLCPRVIHLWAGVVADVVIDGAVDHEFSSRAPAAVGTAWWQGLA